MDERAAQLPASLVTVDDQLAREFETRLAETSTLAFRVAYGVLRQRQDAEDVAQEAFAKAYQRFGQLRDRDRFRGWLVRMTWRLAVDWQRAGRRRALREQTSEVAATAEPSTEEALLARERSETVWRAVDALPEKLRVAVVLAAIEGNDIRAVAQLLGVPDGTVKSRLFLARKRLQESLRWIATDSPTR
jgi:RNA polymerase sigma-70 factor (ECF subfamily)